MKNGKRKHTTITIPTALFDNIKKSIKDTGFSSVSDYATFILRETTCDLALGLPKGKGRGAVVDRLKALGYMQ